MIATRPRGTSTSVATAQREASRGCDLASPKTPGRPKVRSQGRWASVRRPGGYASEDRRAVFGPNRKRPMALSGSVAARFPRRIAVRAHWRHWRRSGSGRPCPPAIPILGRRWESIQKPRTERAPPEGAELRRADMSCWLENRAHTLHYFGRCRRAAPRRASRSCARASRPEHEVATDRDRLGDRSQHDPPRRLLATLRSHMRSQPSQLHSVRRQSRLEAAHVERAVVDDLCEVDLEVRFVERQALREARPLRDHRIHTWRRRKW